MFRSSKKTKHNEFGQGTLMNDLMWLWHLEREAKE